VTYSDALIDFMRAWEGCKLVPSGDPLVPGVVDVGYGHVLQPGEAHRAITHAEAMELLEWDLTIRSEAVDRMVEVDVEQCQHDALVSFAFNVGIDDDDDTKPEGLGDSTLLRCVNAGDFVAAAAEFGKWVRAGGRDAVPGLVKRRAAERAMFVNGDYSGRP